MDTELLHHLRAPFLMMLVLLGLLAVNVALGIFFTHGWAWIVETVIAATMVAIVLTFAMEVHVEPPLTRIFAVAGFFWVLILFTLTMMDYATR